MHYYLFQLCYTDRLLAYVRQWAAQVSDTADTVYLGGGTPSLLGPHRIERIVSTVRDAFRVPQTAEITLEANPGDPLEEVLNAFVAAGGNRLSLGVQSTCDDHLRVLGRRHSVHDVDTAISTAHRSGLHNLSLDLMIATADQTQADIRDAARRFSDWGATHVSAYLLKLEAGTPYAAHPPHLPTEDRAADLYLETVSALASHGFTQYEISNFSKPDCHSRHNLKYWNLDPYIGIGPSAHSFVDGKRLYYPRSLSDFMSGCDPLAENPTDTLIPENSPAEYAMLRLRLCEGLQEREFLARFGTPLPTDWKQRAAAFPKNLVIIDEDGIRFTPEGFLVSDALISRIL